MNISPYPPATQYLPLEEQCRRFLSANSGRWFCPEEMPLKEWKTKRNPKGVSVNNICTRLSEWAGAENPWVEGRYRTDKSYKEWRFIEVYPDGNYKLI
jgi:hypothetical protein